MVHIGLPLRGRPILLSLACLFTDRIGSSVSSITVTKSPAFFRVLQLAPPGCVIYTNVEVSSARVLKSNISAGKYSVTLV